MTAIAICDPCRYDQHDQCEKVWDLPPDLYDDFCGGKMCICDHKDNYNDVYEAYDKQRARLRANNVHNRTT